MPGRLSISCRAARLYSRSCSRSPARILDLGCGTGLFKKHMPDCEYTGIDNSPAYIEYARKRLQGRFILGDIFDLQGHLGGSTFDFAVINGLLHHLDDALLLRLLGTLPALLAPGGRIIVADHIWSDALNPVNKFLVRYDRGAYSRSEAAYRSLLRILQSSLLRHSP